jgi:hypothetical protein
MNTISGLALDRLQTENEFLRRQLNEALAYQRSLEAAVLSVPLFRTSGHSPQERYYEDVKVKWLDQWRHVLDRASRPAFVQRDKLKNALLGKMHVWKQRLGNLVARHNVGDPEVRIPSPNELLDRLIMELSAI